MWVSGASLKSGSADQTQEQRQKERRNAKHKKKDFRRRGNNFPQATTSYNVVRSKEQISIYPLNHGSAEMGVFLASSRKLPEGCSQRADFAAFGRNWFKIWFRFSLAFFRPLHYSESMTCLQWDLFSVMWSQMFEHDFVFLQSNSNVKNTNERKRLLNLYIKSQAHLCDIDPLY